MKFKGGFISNSSSSSFIAVYTKNGDVIAQFLSHLGFSSEEEFCEALYEGDPNVRETSYGIYRHVPSELEIYASCGEVHWIGLDVEAMLASDMKVSECKQEVIKMFTRLGVKLTSEDLEFRSGECSSE